MTAPTPAAQAAPTTGAAWRRVDDPVFLACGHWRPVLLPVRSHTPVYCFECQAPRGQVETLTAEQAYQLAAHRHEKAVARLADLRAKLRQATEEVDAAEAALAEHEARPGIPAYAVIPPRDGAR